MGGKRGGGESEIGEFEDGNSGAGGKSGDSGCDLYTLRYLDMAGLKSGIYFKPVLSHNEEELKGDGGF